MDPSFLVVDDNQLYRTAFCRMVQLCWPAAQVGEAADASQALAMFSQQTWDLIILDYQLPTLSGTDLARHLRARAQARGRALPPLVLMSTQPDAATFARSIGAATFLPKPVELATLRAALTPLLNALTVPQRASLGLPAPVLAATPLIRQISPLSSPIDQLRASIQTVVQQTLNRFPPPHTPSIASQPLTAARRVGDELVQRGYLSRWQLICTLQANRSLPQNARVPLGFTLASQHGVPSAVLSALLLQQFSDRLAIQPASAPHFIGEHLLLQAEIAPAQLAWALQEQIEYYQRGRWVRLGDLLAWRGGRASRPSSVDIMDRLRHN
ncbi:MAG TPA: response regulator [Roseiflexaceae bacterium]|nr:response regulator [Roseiflexaceae bacterium]